MLVNKFIRASSLPTYNDCARSAACHAKVLTEKGEVSVVEYMGFTLKRDGKRNRKSAVGTALHKAAETVLKAKIDKIEIAPSAAREAMLASLDEEFDEEGKDEGESRPIKDKDSAIEYLDAMWGVLEPHIQKLDPVAIEVETHRQLDENTIITGHPDSIVRVQGGLGVSDWKTTGATSPPQYPAQIGEYINQIEDMGLFEEEIVEGSTTTVRRLKLKTPTLHHTSYPVADVQEHAHTSALRFVANLDRFLATGDPHALKADPKAIICSPKYCAAHGTDFCKVGRR